MRPLEVQIWKLGPLMLTRKVFDNYLADRRETQWAVHLEGTLVVITEGDARALLNGQWTEVPQ